MNLLSPSSILVFSTQITSAGGIENHLASLCKSLEGCGGSIVLLCPIYSPSDRLDAIFRESCSTLIVNQWLPPARLTSFFKIGWLLAALAKLQRSSFCSIYINGQGSLAYFVMSYLSSCTNKSVIHHHSSGESDDLESWPRLYTKAMKQSDTVICCSHSNADLVSSYLSRPVEVVYCYSSQCSPRQGQLTISSSEMLNFGFIGRLIPEKGIGTILKLSQDPDLDFISWHLCGPCVGYSKNDFALYPRVTLHEPYSTDEDRNSAYSRLDAFVLFTSHREGLPLCLLEAMSAGIPWIAADRGGIRDLYVSDDLTLIIPPCFTYEQAKSASLRLASHLRQSYFSRSPLVHSYKERFSSDVVAARWASLLLS